ncbi:hypothetical protein O2K51_12690 [Apibacter raozihei]|uniref:hypothetical protein n=1 Tax=Apibacter TaxID=1778601 RepID=UPI000FE34431|nr:MULTISPECIES: hypothetical protein [Apibacter]
MTDQEEILFKQLKKEVTETFLQDFPSSNPDISKWKGLDIIYFQEHLRQKVRGNVSEKWFYTYFKSSFEKLPRIDMLNLLSQYCGYRRGWAEFTENHHPYIALNNDVIGGGSEEKEVDINPNSEESVSIDYNKPFEDTNKSKLPAVRKSNYKKISLIVLSAILILGLIFGIAKYFENKNTYDFCFYDTDRGSLIKSRLEIVIQKQGVSPEFYTINNGCFSYRSSSDTLKMIVSSPMYKKETFVVGLKEIREKGEDNHKNFKLRPDDYAIMLYYYSTAVNSTDEKQKAQLIKQRKEELNKLISDDALIYQVYDSELFGVEVLDKKKYIDFMTTPTTSLKNYVLITSQVNNKNKINLIKFKIQKNEN